MSPFVASRSCTSVLRVHGSEEMTGNLRVEIESSTCLEIVVGRNCGAVVTVCKVKEDRSVCPANY